MKTTVMFVTGMFLVGALSEAADTQLGWENHPVRLFFTFTTSTQYVVQDSIYKFQLTTNKFVVKVQYPESGSNRVRAFDEAHQNQIVRHKIGAFTTPPALLKGTHTTGRSSYYGISEKDVNAIVTALKTI